MNPVIYSAPEFTMRSILERGQNSPSFLLTGQSCQRKPISFICTVPGATIITGAVLVCTVDPKKLLNDAHSLKRELCLDFPGPACGIFGIAFAVHISRVGCKGCTWPGTRMLGRRLLVSSSRFLSLTGDHRYSLVS